MMLPIRGIFSLGDVYSSSAPPGGGTPGSPLPVNGTRIVRFITKQSCRDHVKAISIFYSAPTANPTGDGDARVLLVGFLLGGVDCVAVAVAVLFCSRAVPLAMASTVATNSFFAGQVHAGHTQAPTSKGSATVYSSFLLLTYLSSAAIRYALSPSASEA